VIVAALPLRLWITNGYINSVSILEIAIWIVFAWILIQSINKKLVIGPRLILYAMGVPIIIATLSLLWTENVYSTLKVIFNYSTAFVGYLLIINLFRKESSKYILTCVSLFTIIIIFTAVIFWSRLPIVSLISEYSLQGPLLSKSSLHPWAFYRMDNPFIGKSNDFAPVLALYMFLFIGVTRATRKKFHYTLAILCGISLILTLSRGAIIVSIGLIFILIFKNMSLRKIAVTIITFIFIGVVINKFITEIEKSEGVNIINYRLRADYLESRFERQKHALQTIRNNPLLGQGGGNYIGKEIDHIDSAYHNTYLQQISAYGLIFGSFMIICLLIVPYFFFKYRRYEKSIRVISGSIGFSIISFLLICTNQTANEALVPSLMFRLFIGFSIALISAIYREQVSCIQINAE